MSVNVSVGEKGVCLRDVYNYVIIIDIGYWRGYECNIIIYKIVFYYVV